jgi:uncharacterized protein YigE (DUF2233 family)
MPRQTIVYHRRLMRLPLRACIKAFFRLVSLFFLCSSAQALTDQWQRLAPGIDYIDLGANLLTPWSHVHVFRVDLKKNQLDMIMANALSLPLASIDEFAHYSKALLTINGGFFDHNHHPLGLRIGSQQQYNPLKNISWWGVFYIKNKIPYVSSLHQYKDKQHVDFAIQSGPRLLINGYIPSLKMGRAERSALGISPKGQVIILVTENAPMTTTALAELMHFPPLNCKDALNLDGGKSSQLHAHFHSLKLDVHGFSNVSDAIIVKARKS